MGAQGAHGAGRGEEGGGGGAGCRGGGTSIPADALVPGVCGVGVGDGGGYALFCSLLFRSSSSFGISLVPVLFSGGRPGWGARRCLQRAAERGLWIGNGLHISSP